jgi:hypothetical protein
MNDDEKKLWDDIVRTQASHGQLGELNMCALANKVIEARRAFFALPIYCCSACNDKGARIVDLEKVIGASGIGDGSGARNIWFAHLQRANNWQDADAIREIFDASFDAGAQYARDFDGARISDLEQKLREAHSLIGGERLDALRATGQVAYTAWKNHPNTIQAKKDRGCEYPEWEGLTAPEQDEWATIERAVIMALTGPKKPTKPLAEPWHDRRLDSTATVGPLEVWIDYGAEGWRIHATFRKFVIAPIEASRDEAKAAADEILAELWRP